MKAVDFSETIAASELKVGRYRQLIELCEYSRSRSFYGPRLFTYENYNFLLSETARPF